MGIIREFCSKPGSAHIASCSVLIALLAMAFSPSAVAREDPPLTWFNYFFDTTTTLVYGVPDSDYTPLFFECERANPVVNIHIEHEPVLVRDGESTGVHLGSAGSELELSGTAIYQAMDDLMRVEARTAADESLKRMLAANGKLTITIEGKVTEYPLDGIAEPAARLMEACLATSPDDAPPAVETTSGTPARDADAALATLQAITEIDLTPIALARPEIVDGVTPQITAIQASPDGSMLAILLSSRDIDFPDQAWLYRVADSKLVAATPRPALTPPPYPDGTPASVKALVWQDDTLYARITIWTRDGEGNEGTTAVYAATVDGSRRLDTVPEDIDAMLDDAGEPDVVGQDEVPESDWEILDTIESNADFLVWPYDVGHGDLELRWRQRLAGSPVNVVARGGQDLSQYVFDRQRSRLFYPGPSGIRMLDMSTGTALAMAGTGPHDLPQALSGDGGVFVWSTRNHCAGGLSAEQGKISVQPPSTFNAGLETEAHAKQKKDMRICVAQLKVDAPAGPGVESQAGLIDPWPGTWSGDHVGSTSARIRRGTAKPDYLVVDLVTGMPGCSGAITLYGKPDGLRVHTESYDAKDPGAPVCTVELTLDPKGVLHVRETGDCGYFRGGSCVFDSELTRPAPHMNATQ